MEATGHWWLLSAWNLASITKELVFILINLNLNDYTWLMATIIGNASLENQATPGNLGEHCQCWES